MREIVFDTETTGLDPRSGDRLVEIGCIELLNRVPSGATFHAYCNPQRDMPEAAEAVHGLSSAFLSDKPLFGELAEDLLAFLGDSPLVAHNAGFDFGFLNNELAMVGLAEISLDRMVDTVAIARKKHPGAKLSLDALCTRYGVDRSHRVKHGALLDAELLAQVYVELTGGRQIGLELASLGGEVSSQTVVELHANPAATRERREPRPHSASAEELARHQKFIDRMDAPIWGS
ncbi:MAG: DNA polymerase III subunit epsilon [Sphingomonadales bacterium]|nr:DNA polymerase III subunit epsilon [Sphingomonadales bacterium]MBD3773629.1 DNA polymerase III subunit epsilon [Paracoccaceae bacterium]